VSDAAWLYQLDECGLLRASFVPPEPIRQLRDLTRYRATLAAELADANNGSAEVHQAEPIFGLGLAM
jgi:hypothetical protein